MLTLARRLFVLHRPSTEAQERQNQRPNLVNVPQEILELVIDFMENSDAICLSICNRTLLHKLGTNRFALLRLGQGREDQRRDFLLRLTVDLPGRFYCFTCSYIHATRLVQPPRREESRLAVSNALCCIEEEHTAELPLDCFETHGGPSSYFLAFQHVQLALRAHHRGPGYGIPLQWLFMRKISRSKYYGSTALLTVEPRVISERLHFRVQHVVLVENDSILDPKDTRGPSICTHINRVSGSKLSDLFKCKLQHADQVKACPTCFPLLHCRGCAMDFTVSVERQGPYLKLIVTKWLNLGRGNTPSDPEWRRHLLTPTRARSKIAQGDDHAGPRRIFEAEAAVDGIAERDLTVRNASALSNGDFRVRLKDGESSQT